MLYLTRTDYEGIVAYARGGLPNEMCGLLAGTEDADGTARVGHVYYLDNPDASPEHFTITPAQQLACLKDARANGWRILGNWHSHPETPARPSVEDKRLALDPSARYLILSLAEDAAAHEGAQGSPVLNAYRIARDGFSVRERLEIEG